MERCPSCGAHREPSDDYCPVCGETLTQVHLSEATGPPWHEHTGWLGLLVLVCWPVALYGVYRRGAWSRPTDLLLLGGCLGMAVAWGLLL
ncbi:hypothetical protein [Salinibacter grassmerensis]|uniref:hypothetical protein n=1 Tax=Salinibacter grassmerensis TaxID=3040353 RepID=UPI0021E90C77|nr:hypothetical protein [Salinibacter grassmerensis]